jgi:hypothetical protein
MLLKITDPLSHYPLLLRMSVAETGHVIATGTGFVYEYDNYLYLITNGHCITGVNPETNKRLSRSHIAFPTELKARIRVPHKEYSSTGDTDENGTQNSSRTYTVMAPELPFVNLYQDESCTKPTWYIHPEFGYQVDVVAIPICETDKLPPHVFIYPLNTLNFTLEPEVADDVYVLGYPFGVTDPLEFPIWKKGSIASEPFIPYKGLPMMLIDTATRTGMSGSPVIIKRTGWHELDNGELNLKSWMGTAVGFVGVYSGRYGADENSLAKGDAQLGIVWRKEVIEEILRAKVHGTIEFQTLSE